MSSRSCECLGRPSLPPEECQRNATLICPSCDMLLCEPCKHFCHRCDGDGDDDGDDRLAHPREPELVPA